MIFPIDLQAAAEAIREGRLVVFPTETVYGLGANALDAAAVATVFEAKGRPHSSPLIVHVASIEAARAITAEWPEAAQRLAERFWPGPLTLVLPKHASVPDIVTAGLNNVGVRIPANAIALELIRQAGVPIAAPSANRFTELSPTRAEHVRRSLSTCPAIVLDGGPATIGIESTVVALDRGKARLLRPGAITRGQLEEVIGLVEASGDVDSRAHLSPGQHARHYQPRTPLILANAGALPPDGAGAFLTYSESSKAAEIVSMPADASAYAARLYDVLHELDDRHLDWIAVEPPPPDPEWDGVRDRLTRAARR